MPNVLDPLSYFHACSEALKRQYGITCQDAGLDAEYVVQFLAPGVECTPTEFAEWYGEKMGLDPKPAGGW